MLFRSVYTLTWYPGVPGDTADPLTLLSTSHSLPNDGLASQVEQMVQQAGFVRGTSIDIFPRGNQKTTLTWDEAREINDPTDAAETSLTIEAGLPSLKGWMSIAISGKDTTWKVVPAVVRGVGARYDRADRLLYLTWSVDCGALSILAEGEEPPTIYAPGEVSTGPGVNRGAILRGPNRAYPEA